MKCRCAYVIPLCLILIFLSACSGLSPVDKGIIPAPNMEQTIEVRVAQTLAALPTEPPTAVEDKGIGGVTETPVPTQTQVPPPTETPLPPPAAPEAVVMPTGLPTAKPQTMQDRIMNANILIFEDASEENLIPRLPDVIATMGFSGGTVVNAHQEPGRFLDLLNDGTDWDLIIIANETRVQPNSWLIYDVMPFVETHKTAMIVETWNLDEDTNRGASYLMNFCGIHVEKTWHRADDFAYEDFLIYNFPQSDPILTVPNRIAIPIRPSVYWMSDVGDLMRLRPGSTSRFVAGLYSSDPANYGLITSCAEGRVIVQTFSTHDYRVFETRALWENYITNTLTNHFNAIP